MGKGLSCRANPDERTRKAGNVTRCCAAALTRAYVNRGELTGTDSRGSGLKGELIRRQATASRHDQGGDSSRASAGRRGRLDSRAMLISPVP
jgi:hypothetical protein